MGDAVPGWHEMTNVSGDAFLTPDSPLQGNILVYSRATNILQSKLKTSKYHVNDIDHYYKCCFRQELIHSMSTQL